MSRIISINKINIDIWLFKNWMRISLAYKSVLQTPPHIVKISCHTRHVGWLPPWCFLFEKDSLRALELHLVNAEKPDGICMAHQLDANTVKCHRQKGGGNVWCALTNNRMLHTSHSGASTLRISCTSVRYSPGIDIYVCAVILHYM